MKFIQLKPPIELHDKIKKLAKEEGINIPTFCLNAIEYFLRATKTVKE